MECSAKESPQTDDGYSGSKDHPPIVLSPFNNGLFIYEMPAIVHPSPFVFLHQIPARQKLPQHGEFTNQKPEFS